MLTLEEELKISDVLVARNKVRTRFCEEHNVKKSKITVDMLIEQEDIDTWKHGYEVAHELVQAYMPSIVSIAKNTAARYGITSTTSPDIDDLIQEGILAAYTCTWAFNLRGAGSKMGRRFSSYASLHIKKSIRRAVMKNKTLLKVDVDTIQTSWATRSANDFLRESLGRQPTDEEVRDKLFFKPSGNNEKFLPLRTSMINVDDHENGGINLIADNTDTLYSDDVNNFYANKLLSAVGRVCGIDMMNDFSVYFGVDIGSQARDEVECAKIWGISKVAARRRIDEIVICLTHPFFRFNLSNSVEDKKEVD